MPLQAPAAPIQERELILTRIIDGPREKLFRAWTEPALLKQWFTPRPWTTPVVEVDVRPGGASLFVMRSPEGQDFPNRGVYLDVVKNERLVFTDAFTKAWEPSEKPFMVGTITFEPEGPGGAKTKYTARVQHWTVATARRTSRWGFTPDGARRRINWRRSLRRCKSTERTSTQGRSRRAGHLSWRSMTHSDCHSLF